MKGVSPSLHLPGTRNGTSFQLAMVCARGTPIIESSSGGYRSERQSLRNLERNTNHVVMRKTDDSTDDPTSGIIRPQPAATVPADRSAQDLIIRCGIMFRHRTWRSAGLETSRCDTGQRVGSQSLLNSPLPYMGKGPKNASD